MGALSLACLELTFVMVSILLLHSLKRSIGSPAFYLALGMFFVLGQIISSAKLFFDPGLEGFQINLGNATLLAPYMVAILIVYIIDGTLEAQRMILGLLGVLLMYFYLAHLTASQCTWEGYSAASPGATLYVESLFLQSRRTVLASSAAQVADLFVLPIMFQILHNRNCRLFVSVLGTLIFAQVVDSFVYQLIAAPQLSDWWEQLRMSYLARALVMVWLSVLASVYLHMCNVPSSGRRRPLDIVVAFFGGYGKAMELQRHLREWEGRYRVVIQNSSDLIFILAPDGRVLNANEAGLRGLHRAPGDVNFVLPDIMKEPEGKPCKWQDVWTELHPVTETSGTSFAEASATAPRPLVHRDWEATAADGSTLNLDVHISRAELDEHPVAVVTARDVTERRRMEKEHQELQAELMHAQRLESIGQLAGGVAHDFNNLLHTIQGSLDGLEHQKGLTSTHKSLLRNISEAVSRASGLTSQLLGFARKGKYRSETLNIATVLEHARILFEPLVQKNVTFKVITAPVEMHVAGDHTQLQQVVLNLLINARDAVQEHGGQGKIVLRAEPAAAHMPGWDRRTDPGHEPGHYVCVRVKDDGVGIPEDIRQHIFDPFFTTKDVGKGTGMGLAMAYGCVGNHNGWIHVESEVGKGTEFFVFLPRA
ncbi:MAG: hypothetical protein A3K19_08765 [Lentisphaerae bacterium RIFOXYB12_FULL_65_16]|nr:MAG: hypothetical protein A3K18_02690 [Lentisphaerae bacterium RIFOXYA12_64_32]OGV86024.1 MAG: hypothetical protein A3K19_08765 [Lentisphaerae bacterium RIFOXYB12_FULL_65_16]